MLSKIHLLKYYFKDPNKKPFFKILKELLVYAWAKKEWPVDYFRKSLYRNNITNYIEHLSLKEYYRIIHSKKILMPDAVSLLNNKLKFAEFATAQNIPTVQTLSHNFGNQFYHQSKVYPLNTTEDIKTFFLNVLNSTKVPSLFIKPMSGMGGEHCFLLNKTNLSAQIEKHAHWLLNHNSIHQEKIVQHDKINQIYKESINTLRVNTYLNQHGEPQIISALMRFGTGQLVTDNESSGGFFVGVDIENSRLTGYGQNTIARGGHIHTQHPDSKITLDGFKIPFLKEALKLACDTAKKIPTRIVGWDLAITNQGPIIVEGNYNTSLHMADMAYGGLCTNPVIQTIFKDIK